VTDPGPAPRPDAAKLIYSGRMLFASAALFAVAGVIWLVSGNGPWIGLAFLAIAVAMAVAGRAVSARA
jgi:hypothetical protein